MVKKKIGLFILVGLTTVFMSACAALGGESTVSQEAPVMEPAAEGFYDEAMPEMEMEESAEKRGFASGVDEGVNVVDRMVIYNADMEIAVEDPEAAMQAVIQMAEDAGGFVVNSNLSRTFDEGGSLPRANLTVRVPAGRLESIMTAIKDLTPDPDEDVIYENVSGQDVTAEYTDLESRLRNLEAAESALVDLMEEARDPEDVLNIFDELTYYRGEIEVVKGRMQYLEESVALSAISVRIVAKRSLQPIEIAGWQPKGTVKNAVEALIQAGQFVVDAAIWFGIFCLPFLIPLGIGVYFLVKVIRKRRAKKKAEKAEVIEEQAEEAS